MSTVNIVVAGALANKFASGGEAWVRMSWVRGLVRLGFDVWFVEEIDPGECTDAAGNEVAPDRSIQADYFSKVVATLHRADRSVLLCRGRSIRGPARETIDRVAQASPLVSISGHLRNVDLLSATTPRVHVDIDPGFTQFWAHGGDRTHLEHYDRFATIGLNIGNTTCPIPSAGIDWWPVVQPVVLADWDAPDAAEPGRFTTVGNLRGPFGRVTEGGITYGLKIHEQRKVLDLPSMVPSATFLLAMKIHDLDSGDRRRLIQSGWQITDTSSCVDPDGFRDFVRRSSAEFSVAQGIYVETQSGWFSDRSVRYLAAGRPVVVQDTGLSSHLPVGEGVVTFTDVEEAASAVGSVLDDPARHARAAREIARTYFDSDVVLPAFCERAGIDLPR